MFLLQWLWHIPVLLWPDYWNYWTVRYSRLPFSWTTPPFPKIRTDRETIGADPFRSPSFLPRPHPHLFSFSSRQMKKHRYPHLHPRQRWHLLRSESILLHCINVVQRHNSRFYKRYNNKYEWIFFIRIFIYFTSWNRSYPPINRPSEIQVERLRFKLQ